jgi:hypothetical protein
MLVDSFKNPRNPPFLKGDEIQIVNLQVQIFVRDKKK